MKAILISASALAMTVTGLAAAQDAAGPQRGEYARERGDAPHAGRNHQGGWRAMHGLMRLGAADADGDKQVTRAEFDALRAEEFAHRDRNGDGYLDIEDASPTRQRLAAMREGAGEDGDGRGRRGGRMQAVDADGDGRISRAEFMAAPSPMFDALDANGDAVVTGEEIDARIDERREARSGRREAHAERRAAAAWWRN